MSRAAGGRSPRRARWRGLPELAVASLVAAGLAVVPMGYWRTGLALLGAGLVVAGALRLGLPADEVPLLCNKSRTGDVLALVALGGTVLVLAYTLVYDPPFSLSR